MDFQLPIMAVMRYILSEEEDTEIVHYYLYLIKTPNVSFKN